MTTKASRKRRRKLVAWLMPVLFLSLGACWILVDSYLSRARQTDKYALPTDRSAESMLAFMRTLSGEYDPQATLVKSSNLPSINSAIRSAMESLDTDRSALSPAEIREADYYRLHYGFQGMVNGERGDHVELNKLLIRARRFIRESSEVSAKEANIATYAMLVLDVCGRTSDALEIADLIETRFSDLPNTRHKTSALMSLVGQRNRLRMLNTELQWKTRRLDGTTLDTRELRGKVVLVEFWSTTCRPCIADFPALKRLYSTYHDDGFEIVGVCLHASSAKIKSVTDDHDLPWIQVCHDTIDGNEAWAEQFGINAVPTTMLVDQTGRIIAFGVRPLHKNKRRDLETCLKRMLEGAVSDSE